MKDGRTPRNYGYLRVSTNKQVDGPEVQRAIIEKHAGLDGRPIDAWFTDDAISGGVPIGDRPAGKALGNVLQKGDHVYVAKLDRAFRRAADCANVMDRWQRIGVNLHICNLMGMAINLSSPIGKFIVLILAAVAELEREFASERTRDAMAGRKRNNQACGKYAGYGFTWRRVWKAEANRFVKVRVAHAAERAVMAEIVRWKGEGSSFEEIHRHMAYTLRLETAEGKPWGLKRVQRAYEAELRLRLLEARTDA